MSKLRLEELKAIRAAVDVAYEAAEAACAAIWDAYDDEIKKIQEEKHNDV